MRIQISAPVFKCGEDRNIFLSRLYEIPGFDGVNVKGLDLYLTLVEIPGDTVIKELQEICNMWGTAFKVLEE